MVYPCEIQGSGDLSGKFTHAEAATKGHKGHLDGRPGRAKHAGQGGIPKKPELLMDLIMFYPCCPPEALVNIKEFYENDNLNCIEESDKIFKVSIRNWCSRIREWSIFDFNTYYCDSRVHPYFNSYSRQMGSVYFSVDESLSIANELLMFQCDNDGENVVNFLTDLYNVLDKKIPKKNSILIKSPPSAGKNFFFDAVCSYFLNYGMYGTANKQ